MECQLRVFKIRRNTMVQSLLSKHLLYFKDSTVGSESTVALSLVKVATGRQTTANPHRWNFSTGLFWNKYSSRARKLN